MEKELVLKTMKEAGKPVAAGEVATLSGRVPVGLPWWLSWSRIHLYCGRPGFNPWVEEIPWRRERLPTPVFWPGKFHGLFSPWGHKESDMTERLSL